MSENTVVKANTERIMVAIDEYQKGYATLEGTRHYIESVLDQTCDYGQYVLAERAAMAQKQQK